MHKCGHEQLMSWTGSYYEHQVLRSILNLLKIRGCLATALKQGCATDTAAVVFCVTKGFLNETQNG